MNEENKHKNYFKPDGHLDENSIAICSEWLLGEGPVINRAVLDHLENCLHCRQTVLEVSEIVNGDISERSNDFSARDRFEETCAAKNSPSIRFTGGGQFWKVAAVFLALITVTALTLLIKPNKNRSFVETVEQPDSVLDKQENPDNDSLGKPIDSIIKPDTHDPVEVKSIEKDRFAKNFEPNPGYEALIGAQFRAGYQAKINSPGKDTSLLSGSILIFSGDNPDLDILEIQILNNKAEVLKKFKNLDEIKIKVEMDLDPGLYYWKLLGEDELIQIGKFTLKNTRERP